MVIPNKEDVMNVVLKNPASRDSSFCGNTTSASAVNPLSSSLPKLDVVVVGPDP